MAPAPMHEPFLQAFRPEVSPAAKLAVVQRYTNLTWPEAFAVCWRLKGTVPRPLREALATRVDIMSGPYRDSAVVRPLGPTGRSTNTVATVHSLLSFLVPPTCRNATLWTTLMGRATPAGQRRLVEAHGNNLLFYHVPRTWGLWTAATWALLPALYPPGTPMDSCTAEAIRQAFERDAESAPEPNLLGDLWVDALLATPEGHWSTAGHRARARQANGSSPRPPYCTRAAITRLLVEGPPHLREWALTTLVPTSATLAMVQGVLPFPNAADGPARGRVRT